MTVRTEQIAERLVDIVRNAKEEVIVLMLWDMRTYWNSEETKEYVDICRESSQRIRFKRIYVYSRDDEKSKYKMEKFAKEDREHGIDTVVIAYDYLNKYSSKTFFDDLAVYDNRVLAVMGVKKISNTNDKKDVSHCTIYLDYKKAKDTSEELNKAFTKIKEEQDKRTKGFGSPLF